ncbi:nematode resistance protein-like HSPRO2 [Syzygium oleosum]|uniref:nematode resistance protein-like HSPRO2 n=1 Tax=Syzygium oleosum TaxID=219896 RepID=UPI0024BA8E20|nr:nematode resistance protein-like HSPRO2 [Syzygium oleosum]
MVDFDCETKAVSPPDASLNSPTKMNGNSSNSNGNGNGNGNKQQQQLPLLLPATPPFRCPAGLAAASAHAVAAYEQYLRLPELRRLWGAREFPGWKAEPLLRPALQALEITFRFVSTALSDPRPYANRREWRRRLESLAAGQVQLVAAIVEDEEGEEEGGRAGAGAAPLVELSSAGGALARGGSSAEVWRIPGGDAAAAVSRASEGSLLPRLATWHTSEDVAQRILYTIECEMRRCPYTLGLGEPNLTAKPALRYDDVCKPSELHSLKRNASGDHQVESNHENQSLHATHQILESWIRASSELLKRISERIEANRFEKAASDCYLLERFWKLLAEIEDLHLLMDPEDFLRLKKDLAIRAEAASFCFRSKGLVEITGKCKDLKHTVPRVLGVEADPNGGPRLQEAAMRLYREKREAERIHLLQALQAVEAAAKRFFFAYKQVVAAVMGSLEARGDRVAGAAAASSDSLSRVFLENTYFPSLDAAKTFLGRMLSGGGGDDGKGGRSSDRHGSGTTRS